VSDPVKSIGRLGGVALEEKVAKYKGLPGGSDAGYRYQFCGNLFSSRAFDPASQPPSSYVLYGRIFAEASAILRQRIWKILFSMR